MKRCLQHTTDRLQRLLNDFAAQSRDILRDNLVGIYLHGSAAMGCFRWEQSDVDLLVVVRNTVADDVKRRYMDMTVALNRQAPAKGMEISVIRREICDPFVYPTPYELHFSRTHLSWYQINPQDYIAKMKGTDKDLAAHITILCHRGLTVCGEELRTVFGEVGREYYLDSLLYDVGKAEEEIADNPMYLTLNLCRVLAYQRENLILSKREGGEWGLANVPEKYAGLISDALAEYLTGTAMKPDRLLAREYAGYMLKLSQLSAHSDCKLERTSVPR